MGLEISNDETPITEHEVELYRPLTRPFYTLAITIHPLPFFHAFIPRQRCDLKSIHHNSGSRRPSLFNKTGTILPQTVSSFFVISHLKRLLNTPQEMRFATTDFDDSTRKH